MKKKENKLQKTEIKTINTDEYGNILQQSVEQIRAARTLLARQIVSTTQSVYWNLGSFYERFHLADEKLLRSVAVLPWYQNLLLLDKVQSFDAYSFKFRVFSCLYRR